MMMMMAILIWYGLGVQGQHVYRALKRTWELFTVSEMAMGCVYLCFSTPRVDCVRQWKDGWDLFTSMFGAWGNWILDTGLVDWWTGGYWVLDWWIGGLVDWWSGGLVDWWTDGMVD